MRKPKVEEPELLAGLMSVLRSKGYDGASLNELSAACGLQKASLYHRFPGGKKEIATAVLSHVHDWVDQHIYKLLCNDTIAPQDRLTQAIENIREIYGNGKEVCIIRALSMDGGLQFFQTEIQSSIETWITAFTTLGQAYGLSEESANYKAIQALSYIQGSLVVSKGLGNTKPFDIALASIKHLYQV